MSCCSNNAMLSYNKISRSMLPFWGRQYRASYVVSGQNLDRTRRQIHSGLQSTNNQVQIPLPFEMVWTTMPPFWQILHRVQDSALSVPPPYVRNPRYLLSVSIIWKVLIPTHISSRRRSAAKWNTIGERQGCTLLSGANVSTHTSFQTIANVWLQHTISMMISFQFILNVV